MIALQFLPNMSLRNFDVSIVPTPNTICFGASVNHIQSLISLAPVSDNIGCWNSSLCMPVHAMYKDAFLVRTCLGLALSTNILYIFIFPAPKINLDWKKNDEKNLNQKPRCADQTLGLYRHTPPNRCQIHLWGNFKNHPTRSFMHALRGTNCWIKASSRVLLNGTSGSCHVCDRNRTRWAQRKRRNCRSFGTNIPVISKDVFGRW